MKDAIEAFQQTPDYIDTMARIVELLVATAIDEKTVELVTRTLASLSRLWNALVKLYNIVFKESDEARAARIQTQKAILTEAHTKAYAKLNKGISSYFVEPAKAKKERLAYEDAMQKLALS